MSGRSRTSDVAVAERPTESRRRADRSRGVVFVPAPELTPEQQSQAEPTQAPKLRYGLDSVATTAPAPGQAEEASPRPVAMPVPAMSPEEMAQREAQVAEAQASLTEAGDTPALMAAFTDAPPTVKAQVAGELGDRFGVTLGRDSQALSDETPELRANLDGSTPAPAGQITPHSGEVVIEETPPAQIPSEAVVGDPPSAPESYGANDAVVAQIARSFSAEAGAEDVASALNSVQTSDPSITTSPGTAPAIPLTGDADPQRIAQQTAAGVQQGRDALADQQRQTDSLPGVERVQLAAVHESYTLGELKTPAATSAPAPDGAQQYLALEQPPDVQAAFDDVTGASMRESMAEARGQIDQAATERDEQHQLAVAQAEAATESAEAQARADQSDVVAASRSDIEAQRQSTIEQQQSLVEDAELQAADRGREDLVQIGDRVRDDQAELDQRYLQAETDAETEVQRGEREAEAERARAEREAEDQSWWEAALDVITDLFDALVGLINDIFDAVRAAVNTILDAVRDFALALIDLAADFVKGLVEAYATFLKGLVQGLLGELFPELARALTEFIDTAVELANSAVDAVANSLKSAVNTIVETLRAGINSLIDIYQAAVNTALALARAALTGDWSGFIIQLIEAACRVAGLDSQEVFAFIGRAQETIQLIVDNPAQFLWNVVEALAGGVRRFATNFATHLQVGIIGWLTGTLGGAGITLPERFDLMGVISLVAQILGLTWENLRLRLVRLVGERGVAVLEFVSGYVQTLIEGGWSGLWERIQTDLTTLRDIVFEQIRNYIVERIIVNAIRLLATMWEPVGWIVNLLIATYQFFTFVYDQFSRMAQLVVTVVDAIGNIARGVLGAAQERVESFLGGLLPLAIDLLARLLGLGNIGGRVREIITSVQEAVWGAIDRLVERAVGLFRGGAGATTDDATAAAQGGAAGQIGERIPIVLVDGETHHLSIEAHGRDATLVVESSRTSLESYHSHWQTRLKQLPDDDARSRATTLLAELKSRDDAVEKQAETTLANAATTAGSGQQPAVGSAANSTVVASQRGLAPILFELFTLFKGTRNANDTKYERLVIERYQKELGAGDTDAQRDVFEEIAERPSVYYKFGQNAWGQVKAHMSANAEFLQKPLLGDHQFGRVTRGWLVPEVDRMFQQRQAIAPNAPRPNDVNTVITDRIGMIHSKKPPFLHSLDGIRLQIFDQGQRSASRQQLEDEFTKSVETYGAEGLPEHRAYKPIYLDGYDDSSFPTIKYTYAAPDSPLFEVTLGANRQVLRIQGTQLRFKHFVDDIVGRGVTDRSPDYVQHFFLNASHLIADEFTGSGFAKARNIVSTSAYYNQVVMRNMERNIGTFIQAIARLHAAGDLDSITFELDVSVEYGTAIITQDILKLAQAQVLAKIPQPEQAAFTQEWQTMMGSLVNASAGLQRVMQVTYTATVLVNDQLVPDNSTTFPPLGPDIFLGMDDEKLRPIMRGGR